MRSQQFRVGVLLRPFVEKRSVWFARPKNCTVEAVVDVDAIREYCFAKRGKVREDMPFGEDTLVLRIDGKIFLLMNLMARPLTISLKCDPLRAVQLRERYASVVPGYHLNKAHWNTVVLDGAIPTKEIYEMIDHSYDEVVKGMKKGPPKKPAKKRVKQ